ncbi:TraR/DksA family transcriptional regulator [Treponema sp.]|uniref:TraR/DksA family transcriptional regulator n=1 Tax=Treponema sp. TaxID=166 RepID=UPI00298E0394|nr:TraR/DksA family transcriptional regulator [Treponema sp.]MCR5612426.1 TraR/DksA family transcriptional regulator [Treponema sp.]
MKKEFIEKMRNKLTTQRNEILASLEKKSEDFKGLVNAVESGDVCDIASDAIDRTMLDSLSQQDADRLNLINNALNRIAQGKYGICISCGKDIPMARLEALPWTGMCIDCKSKSERNGR